MTRLLRYEVETVVRTIAAEQSRLDLWKRKVTTRLPNRRTDYASNLSMCCFLTHKLHKHGYKQGPSPTRYISSK